MDTAGLSGAPPTIYDVADRAGVSIATVSRALNGHSYLRPETRERVLLAVRELRFVPNGSARGLSSRMKRILALVFVRLPVESDLMVLEQESLLFTDSVIRGAEYTAQRLGYSLLLSGVGDGDPGRIVEGLTGQADGLILQDRVLADRRVAPLAKRFPTVLLSGSGRSRSASTVRVDNRSGMEEVAEHLVVVHGHQRVAFFGGIADSPDSSTRERAFTDAVGRRGAQCVSGPAWSADWTSTGARRAMEVLLAAGEKLPQAIVCANDQMAIGVMHALGRAGVAVPGDVAVTGFDDIPVARHLHPTLTTVRQPSQQLGATGVEVLVSMVEGTARSGQDVVLPVGLRVRGSCGCSPPPAEFGSELDPWTVTA